LPDVIARIQPSRKLTVAMGRGCWYADEEGERYLDLLSGCWSAVLGHCHEEFNEAVKAQVDRLVHAGTGCLSPQVIDGVEALVSTLGEGYRAVLLNSGSEAVDLAIKLAKTYTGKREVVSFERGYYGASTDLYMMSGMKKASFFHPVNPGYYKLLAPDCRRCPLELEHPGCDFRCLDVSRQLLEASFTDDVAAVVFEPVMAAGGVLVPPDGYYARVERMARGLDALLVANEVTTGCGRTGRWYGFKHDGVRPDVVAVGKCFGNGFPVAGVLMRSEIEEGVFSAGFTDVQSHQLDPLSGLIVSEVVRIVRRDRLVERAADAGRRFVQALQGLAGAHRVMTNVRGRGLMLAFDVDEGGDELQRALLERKVVLDYLPAYRTFRMMPALVIEDAEIDHFVDLLDEAIARVR